MQPNIIERVWRQDKMVNVDVLNGFTFTDEEEAHRFIISGKNVNTPVDITGTITANFKNAGGVLVPLTGTIEDGKAVVVLSRECYAVEGPFSLMIFADTVCIYAAIANVINSSGEVIAYPTATIPSVQELIEEAQGIIASIPQDYSALNQSVQDLKSAVDPMLDTEYVLQPISLYGNNNTAMVSNGDGSYTAGTTDYGNSTFGSSMTSVPAGDYYLYGVPQGIAFLTTVSTGSTSYNNRIAENTTSEPKLIHIDSTVSVCLGYRITAKPLSAVTIYPSLYKLVPKIDRAALMENVLANNTDLNDVRTVGAYFLSSSNTYIHAPNISGGGIMYVHAVGTNLLQMIVQYGTNARTYTPNICFRWGSPSSITIDWKYMGRQYGLRTAFIGDSIIWGRNGNGQATDQTPYTIPDAIAHNLGIVCENMGVSGMGWVHEGDGNVIAYDVISGLTLSNYDALIISLGVNDGFNNLGTWDSTDETTIMGQFNKCINYIMTNRPQMRIVIVAPINGRGIGSFPGYWYGPRENTNGYVSRRVLSDTLKQACEYYWIPYIEQYDGPINPYSIQTLIGTDGVHPSNAGYLELGRWMSEKLGAVL